VKKILSKIILVLALSLVGCTTVAIDVETNQQIIDKYYSRYLAATNSSNLHIDAMLKSFSSSVNHGPPYTWEQAMEWRTQYIKEATTHQISSNYSQKATDEEGRLLDGFINDVIIVNQYSQPRFFGLIMSDMSAAFIFRLNDYEYDKNNDK
jgi:hypothetical protein